MRNIRKIAVLFLVGVFLLSMVPPFEVYGAGTIKIFLNGKEIKPDVPPVMKSKRVLVPFRFLSENLGAGVHWDERTRTITAEKGGTEIILKIGNPVAYINGKPVKLDVPALIVNGRTLVPIRFFSEAFGAQVGWDGAKMAVFITIKEGLAKYVLGYYYSQSYDDFVKNADKLSSIAAKWYTLDQNSNLTSYDNSRWIMKPEEHGSVLETARQNGVKVFALIFENDRARLSQALGTPEKRKALVDQIVNEVEKENYDGVNIDFEYIKPEDGENFSNFILELYNALKSKNKTLSLSLPAKTEKHDWWPAYDYEILGRYSDFAVVMAYDRNPGTPGPQAGVDWTREVVDYAIARIPAQKVVLGIGYYGYAWAESGRYTVLEEKNQMTYSRILFLDELKSKYGLKMNLDGSSLMAYGSFKDEKGATYQIWMENRASVDAKCKLVIEKGLKGIAVWRLGYTTANFWQAVNDNFKPAK